MNTYDRKEVNDIVLRLKDLAADRKSFFCEDGDDEVFREDPATLCRAIELLQIMGESKTEYERWNNANCDTCPLRGWEKCDEICVSKLSMAKKIVKLANDIDLKLQAMNDAEKRAEALEQAVEHNCYTCVNWNISPKGYACTICRSGKGKKWKFDIERFSKLAF